MATPKKTTDNPLEGLSVASGPVSTDDLEAVSRHANSDVTVRDRRRKLLGRAYEAEPKTSVMIAPMYSAYFGKNMHVSLNGISVAVPCNGKPYSIPKSFAAVVQERLRAVNDQQTKQKRFSNIAANHERAPGELALY